MSQSDQNEIEQLQADLDRRRKTEQPKLPAKLALTIPPAMTSEREAEMERREAAAKESERRGRIAHFQQQLNRQRGKRYVDCFVSNFTLYGSADDQAMQRAVVESVRGYCQNIDAHIADSYGLFLFGPCGTGKDHLAMAVARAFIHATAEPVRWVCGAELYQRLRESFGGKGTEGEVLRPYATAPLLWISDPLPVKGELSQFEAGALYRLIEQRYSNRRPTLITVNLGPEEADHQFGAAVARRLRETTLQLYCNWPSFRKPSPAP